VEIAVLGTGSVGRTLAARFDELGHTVTIGTRDPDATAAKDQYAAWAAGHQGVRLEAFEDAAGDAPLVVNACAGAATLDVLRRVGAERLAGRVLLDISNALDHSGGFPPTLFIKDTDSMAERIQRAYPDARVVKSLNTMNAALMADPGRLPEATTVFVSGNDPDAKAVVTALLTEMGHSDVLDLGDVSTARGPEMYVALWLRAWGALGTLDFNIKVVR
jgi:predicted dinucleotide-binding enzyme